MKITRGNISAVRSPIIRQPAESRCAIFVRCSGLMQEEQKITGKAENSRKKGRQDKTGDVRSPFATVEALFLKPLRRSAVMCGPNPALWIFHEFPLFAQLCRTSRSYRS